MLARNTTSTDLGPDHFDRRDADTIEHQLVKRPERLGNTVTREKVA